MGKDETLEATEDIEGSNLAEIMVSQCLPHLCIVRISAPPPLYHACLPLSLSPPLYPTCLPLSPPQALQKIHETFQSDIEAENNRINQLEALAQELNDYQYYNVDAVNARMQSIKDTAAHLQQLADTRKQRIQEAIDKQQNLDSLRLNFAKKAAVSRSRASLTL